MANGNGIGFEDLLGLYAFGPSYGALKTRTKKRGAQKDLLDFLSESGGLGGTTPELAGGQAVPPAVTTGQFDPAGVAGLAIGQPTPSRPVRESAQFEDKLLGLLASQDQLGTFLTRKPEKKPLPSIEKIRVGDEQVTSLLDPRTGETIKELGRGKAFAPKGGGAPMTATKASERITKIEQAKFKLQTTGGLDPTMLLLLSETENGQEVIETYKRGDKIEALEQMEREIQLLEQFVPEKYRRPKKTEGAKPTEPGLQPYKPGGYKTYQ